MKIMYRFYFLIPVLLSLLTLKTAAQKPEVSWQIILEAKGEYNDLNHHSRVNPENGMNLREFNSLTQLYPILKFTDDFHLFRTTLQIEAGISNYNFAKDSTDFIFQELYIQWSMRDKHYFVIGKKRLDWGTGTIWNPTNFFIQKDPLRTQNRLEGIFMINYAFLFAGSACNLYIFPDKDRKDFKFALKYEYTGNRFDASISFLENGKYQQFGYDFAYGGNRFTLYAEGVWKNFTKSFRIREDGSLTPPYARKKKFRGEFVVGGSVNLNSRWSLLAEYRYRQDYPDRRQMEWYTCHLPANPELFDPVSMGRHSLFCNLGFTDLYDRWSVTCRAFFDPSSRQWTVSPLGIWKMNNFQLELSAMGFGPSLSVYDLQTTLLISCYF